MPEGDDAAATVPPEAPDPGAERALLEVAAREAGEIALGFFRGAVERWEKPGLGPVSAADLAVDGHLRERLTAARPGYGWLSEESPRLAPGEGSGRAGSHGPQRLFVVDPIDGTRAFLAGDTGWGIAVAVVEGGRAIAAVMHLPARGETYAAARGAGATRDGRPIHVSARADLAGARVLIARRQLRPELWPGGLPPVEPHFRPSLVWRLCLVADGSFDAMVTLRDAHEWDIAPGALIAAEAGARVSDRTGAEPLFDRHPKRVAGVIAAPPALHRALLGHLGLSAD